ncbi:MAG: PQQ-binding-like beta-propeller repeat protein [Gemmataceae bacterium]
MTRLALILSVPLLTAADWPQWRGPGRDGHAPGYTLPATWPKDAPAPRWKVPAGDGYAGLCVAAGKVFVHDRVGDKERVRALDAKTGKELWAIDYAEAFAPPDPTAGKGPGSTPAFDRDRVYTFGLGGVLLALDAATGKQLWRHDCKTEFWGQKKGPLGDDTAFPPCGVCASPLVDGDSVVVNVGGPKAGTFVAFDRVTGKVVWKALEDRSSYASPLLAAPGGVKQLVCFTGTRMVGVKYEDKSLLWGVPFKALYDQTIITPVVWKDRVVIAGEGRPTFAVTVPKSPGEEPQTAWKTEELKSYMTTPVVFGDHLVGFDHRTTRLVCLSLDKGETAWTSPRIPGKYHSLATAGGAGFCLTSEGELVVFRLRPDEWTELARWTVCGRGSWSHLAIADGRLYVKDAGFVYCVDLPG